MIDESIDKHLKEWKKYLIELKSIKKKDVYIEYRIESVERLIVFNSK